MPTLTQRRLARLDMQGFDTVDEAHLAEVAPWLGMAFGLCAAWALLGTLLGSPGILVGAAGVALAAALSPVHPFDLIYNHGIRRLTRTRPLPRRGAPARFACGMGVPWLLGTAWAFESGAAAGYGLGLALAGVAILVATTDFCIPSLLYRTLFSGPRPRSQAAAARR